MNTNIPNAMLEQARDLLPGLGFFGMAPPLQLDIAVDAVLDNLRLFFDSGRVQSYLFPAIQFYAADGKEIPRADLVDKVQLTSSFGDVSASAAKDAVITGTMLRSDKELRPEMQIRFDKARHVARVSLLNHRGTLARRGRHVNLCGYHRREQAFFYRNLTPGRFIAERARICADLGLPEAQHDNDGLRAMIVARLDAGTLDWPARRLAELLPLGGPMDEVSDFQRRIGAEVVVRILGKGLRAGSKAFMPLAPIMSSRRRIADLLAETNMLLSARLGREVTIQASKHSFTEPKLVMFRDRYLDGLDTAFPVLKECGVTAMLCYGTLLGAVREGGFLAHDDDVDLLYFDGSRSREEAQARRHELIERLSGHGLRLSGSTDRNMNFHIRCGGVVLDLFPSWEEGGAIHTMMEGARYRPVPRQVLLPTGEVELHGRRYPAPATPEAFLADRYGEDWLTPNPFFSWPWRLDEDEAMPPAVAHEGKDAKGAQRAVTADP